MDFIPSEEATLVTWSNQFSSLINASPESYGLTALTATAFANLNTAWVDAYAISQGNDTRTPSSIIAKDEAKDAMVENARELAKIIQADPSVTNEQRSDLGLTVPSSSPTPISAPASPPGLIVESVSGRTVNVRLENLVEPSRRGKPFGAIGATVMMAVGDDVPTDPLSWTFLTNTSKTKIELTVPNTVPANTQVWLSAFWYTAKALSSEPSAPVSATIGETATYNKAA